MNKDTIIRLARDTHGAMLASGRGMYLWHGDALAGDVQDFCERFAALVAAHEREECAKVCEAEADKSVADQEAGGMYVCAAAIRSRT